jgi:hypothetical protein
MRKVCKPSWPGSRRPAWLRPNQGFPERDKALGYSYIGRHAQTAPEAIWDGDRTLCGDRLTIGGRPAGPKDNVGQGSTPGIDIAHHTGRTAGLSTVAVESGDDRLGLGRLLVTQTTPR